MISLAFLWFPFSSMPFSLPGLLLSRKLCPRYDPRILCSLSFKFSIKQQIAVQMGCRYILFLDLHSSYLDSRHTQQDSYLYTICCDGTTSPTRLQHPSIQPPSLRLPPTNKRAFNALFSPTISSPVPITPPSFYPPLSQYVWHVEKAKARSVEAFVWIFHLVCIFRNADAGAGIHICHGAERHKDDGGR